MQKQKPAEQELDVDGVTVIYTLSETKAMIGDGAEWRASCTHAGEVIVSEARSSARSAANNLKVKVRQAIEYASQRRAELEKLTVWNGGGYKR